MDKLDYALRQASQEQPIVTAGVSVPQAATESSQAKVAVWQQKSVPAAPALGVSGLESVVNGWSKAWSEQDVEGYLAFYSPDFDPPDTKSRAAWENQRRSSLTRPKFINVALQDIKIDIVDPATSRIRFTQSFKSNTYADKVTKQLEMKKGNEGWRILSENEVK